MVRNTPFKSPMALAIREAGRSVPVRQRAAACEGGDSSGCCRMTEDWQHFRGPLGAASDVVRLGRDGCMDGSDSGQSVHERESRPELESGVCHPQCRRRALVCGLRPRPCCKTRWRAANEPDESRPGWSLRDRMAVKQAPGRPKLPLDVYCEPVRPRHSVG